MTDTFPVAWIQPDWPAIRGVRAFTTTREGESNLKNDLSKVLPVECAPRYINQVHGAAVVNADQVAVRVDADASWTCNPHVICVVRTADCLPILLADSGGHVVAAVHTGWRGLLAGVIGNAVGTIRPFTRSSLYAWIGPGISAQRYEVDTELRDQFVARNNAYASAFCAKGKKWSCDLLALAHADLETAGVHDVYGGSWCTYSEPERFHSYRRDADKGRMLSMIWLSNPADVTQ